MSQYPYPPNPKPHPASLHKPHQDPAQLPFRPSKSPDDETSQIRPYENLNKEDVYYTKKAENPKKAPTYALNSDLDSLKYRIYPEDSSVQEGVLDGVNLRNSYEDSINYPLRYSKEGDLETVHERSVESELTYKTSIIDMQTNKDSFKEAEDFFPNSTRKSEPKNSTFKSFEGYSTARLEDSRLGEKIKVIDNLKQDSLSREEIQMKLNAILIENENLKSENMSLRADRQRLREDLAQKINFYQQENEKLKSSSMQLEEELYYRKQEIKKTIEENRLFRLEKETFVKKLQLLQNDKEELDRINQILMRKSNEVEKEFQLHLEEFNLIQEKKLNEKVNELMMEKQYKFHTKEKIFKENSDRLRSENDALRGRNELLIQKLKEKHQEIDMLSNRKPDMNNTLASPVNISMKRAFDDLLMELDIKANNLEEMHTHIAEFKNYYKQMTKFTELVLDMTVNCHPANYFENNKPTLKQAWKWLKNILEKYMVLKKSTLRNEEGLKIAMENEENNELISKIMENLKVSKRSEILMKFYQYIHENNIFNRMIPKMKRILKLDKKASLKEVEKRLDEIP